MAKVKRPDVVWLGHGHRWTIQWPKHELNVDGDPCNGVTHVEERRIEVRVEGTENFMRQVLIHETLHAMIASNGRKHHEDEEHCVRVNEGPLFALLADPRNKAFRDYIGAGEQ